MTTTPVVGAPTASGRSIEHQAATDHVTSLILPAQTPGAVSLSEITRIIDEAEEHGWWNVVMVAYYVAVLASRYDPGIDGREHWLRLLERARREGDLVWEALALAMGATDAVDTGRPKLDTDRDLARATVMLRQVTVRHDVLGSAHSQASMAYLARDMWDLALDHTDSMAGCYRVGEGDEWRLAISMYNRAEINLRRLCALRQSGPRPELTRFGEVSRAALQRVPLDLLPESWRTDLHIFENLVDAIAPPAGAAPRELAQREGAEFGAYVDLAEAFTEPDPTAARVHLARALAALDPAREPETHLLALTLDAELESRELGHETAGLRLGRELAARREHARAAALEAMGSLIENEEMAAEHARLRVAAELDALTGVANRRGLSGHVDKLTDEERGGRDEVTLVLVDVDHFKTVNDTFGHEVGDEVLVRVATSLRGVVRDSDLVVRWGGDEFLLLLDTDDLEAATRRCTDVVENVRGDYWDDLAPGLAVTVSIGLAVGKVTDLVELRDAADRALYRAKQRGRDGVSV